MTTLRLLPVSATQVVLQLEFVEEVIDSRNRGRGGCAFAIGRAATRRYSLWSCAVPHDLVDLAAEDAAAVAAASVQQQQAAATLMRPAHEAPRSARLHIL